MSEHTPLPWHASRKSVYVSDINHTCIAQMLRGQDENEANAAFIVKVVNAHDVLVRALEDCLREHGGFTIKGDCEKYARAALALAGRMPLSPDLKASQRPTVSSETNSLTKGTEPGAVTDGREQQDHDIGILLSALRYHEEAVGETFDDCGGVIAQIEADHKARQPALIDLALSRNSTDE